MKFIKLIVLLCIFGICAGASAYENDFLFSSDWSTEIDKRIQLQEPLASSIELVSIDRNDIRKAIKITINKDDDYSRVANGSPRAEMSFNGFLHFNQKKEYVISWEIYIPENYRFDSKQPELIAQIHQGPPAGYPPFALFFSENGKYEVHNRTQSNIDSVNGFFGNPLDDKGRLVRWQLHYIPDSTGETAVTELKKDGKVVYATKGVANAYENDDRSYLKLGIYKADWMKKPSDVDSRTLYYGRTSVRILN